MKEPYNVHVTGETSERVSEKIETVEGVSHCFKHNKYYYIIYIADLYDGCRTVKEEINEIIGRLHDRFHWENVTQPAKCRCCCHKKTRCCSCHE